MVTSSLCAMPAGYVYVDGQPDQNAFHVRTHYREKRGNFQTLARIREIKKKR